MPCEDGLDETWKARVLILKWKTDGLAREGSLAKDSTKIWNGLYCITWNTILRIPDPTHQTSLTGYEKGFRVRRELRLRRGVRGQEDTAGGEGAGSAGVATLHFAGAAAALRGVPCGAEQRYERLRRRP